MQTADTPRGRLLAWVEPFASVLAVDATEVSIGIRRQRWGKLALQTSPWSLGSRDLPRCLPWTPWLQRHFGRRIENRRRREGCSLVFLVRFQMNRDTDVVANPQIPDVSEEPQGTNFAHGPHSPLGAWPNPCTPAPEPLSLSTWQSSQRVESLNFEISHTNTSWRPGTQCCHKLRHRDSCYKE